MARVILQSNHPWGQSVGYQLLKGKTSPVYLLKVLKTTLGEKKIITPFIGREKICQGAESQGRSLPLTTLYAHPCIQPLPISASARPS